MKKRANLYIDGPNIYNRINDYYRNKKNIKNPKQQYIKRLNYIGLFENIIKKFKNYEINKIYFFSAIVPKGSNKKSIRHEEYVKSLEMMGIEVILGYYEKNKNGVELLTDVKLGARMTYDSCSGNCDAIFLFSGDHDFEGAIKYSKKGNPKTRVHLIAPPFSKEAHCQTMRSNMKPLERQIGAKYKAIDVEFKELEYHAFKGYEMNHAYEFIDGYKIPKLKEVKNIKKATKNSFTSRAKFFVHANSVKNKNENYSVDYKKSCDNISTITNNLPVDLVLYFSTDMTEIKKNIKYENYIKNLKKDGIEIIKGTKKGGDEKKTLVNITSRMIYEAWVNNFAEIYLLSVDNQLIEGIKFTKIISPDSDLFWLPLWGRWGKPYDIENGLDYYFEGKNTIQLSKKYLNKFIDKDKYKKFNSGDGLGL